MIGPISSPISVPSPLPGWRIERHPRLSSTSDEAKRRAIAGDPGNVWIVADEQTSGRGRQGRVWTSPPGNLYATALLVGPCEIVRAPQIGFVAGVALRRAVADLGARTARLKWPNDLVDSGAKLAGLLVEGLTIPGGVFCAAVGIGVNVASAPEGLAYPTTHLSRLQRRPVAVEDLLIALARRFHEALALWDRGAGFAAIRAAWLEHAAGLGGRIRVSGREGAREGVFEGLDRDGRLLFRANGAIETIESADLALISNFEGAPPRGAAEHLDGSRHA